MPYHRCPLSLNNNQQLALGFIDENGPLTPSGFKTLFGTEYPQLKNMARKLLYDLYNYGKIARMGRRGQKPLYHVVGKVPYELDMSQISEEEAKEWLFLKCLSTYGPLTLKDVAHWVGWNITETTEILNALLGERKVKSVNIAGDPDTHYVRVEDTSLLNSLVRDLPVHSFIRILFNDDALLLGYYRRLKDYLGYRWRYPQLSEGIVWRAAILCGRQLIGEAVADIYAKSQFFKVKRLTLRKEFASPEILSRIEDEFMRHAEFQNKTLETISPKLT